jgi:DnaJ-class molecular chaperone
VIQRARSKPPSVMEKHLDALELQMGSNISDVRRAYYKAAAKWHPDKWMTKTKDEREAAEERFRLISQAYEALTSI